MRILRFTFKNEAIWMMVISSGLVLLGLIGILIITLARG